MHRDPIIVIRTMFRVVVPILLCALLWLPVFGLGLLKGTVRGSNASMADQFGLWGWAIIVAFMALITAVPILDKVFKKTGGINHVSHDDTLVALHALGGTCLVWDAYPVGDGALEIGSLHLEDRTGKPVRFGGAASRYRSKVAARSSEDAAYEFAKRYSHEPGHYVLALPSGTVISAPSRRRR
jgi:hypothetical protein